MSIGEALLIFIDGPVSMYAFVKYIVKLKRIYMFKFEFILCRSYDPIFTQAIPLKPHELKTFTTKVLQPPTMCNNNTMDANTITDSTSECKVQLISDDTAKEENTVKVEVEEEVYTIKPGWFGKGCRKRVTKRRRSSQVSIESVKEDEVKEEV